MTTENRWAAELKSDAIGTLEWRMRCAERIAPGEDSEADFDYVTAYDWIDNGLIVTTNDGKHHRLKVTVETMEG